jgi:hypothetical protein
MCSGKVVSFVLPDSNMTAMDNQDEGQQTFFKLFGP